MATAKKTTETVEKKTTTRKRTTKKTVAAQSDNIVELKKPVEEAKERSVFELMAEKFPVKEAEVETPVGVIKIKNRISLNDMVVLVNLIVNMCTDSQTGMVKWEIYDYVVKLVISAVYCGIDVPQDLEVGYNAVCGEGDLFTLVERYADEDQLIDIWDSTRAKLRAQEKLNCSVAVGKLNQFLESVSELMEAIGSVSADFNGEEAAKALEQLSVLMSGK